MLVAPDAHDNLTHTFSAKDYQWRIAQDSIMLFRRNQQWQRTYPKLNILYYEVMDV